MRETASSLRVSNTEDQKLNLVHTGDLVKLGFGLDGDRGLGVFAAHTADFMFFA
jgi:hypothetical protein